MTAAASALALAEAPAGPVGRHLVEARLDLLSAPASEATLAALARAAPGRLLVTCRPGGTGSPAHDDRLRLLARAVEVGAAACDLERGCRRDVLPASALVVASHHHDDELAPEQAAALARELAAGAPDIVKLAAPVASAAKALELARAAAAVPPGVGFAPVPLGTAGLPLRLLAPRPGPVPGRPLSALAYVRAQEPLPGVDPGQPGLDEALGAFGVPQVSESTRVHAVVGWPLARTWSPRLHSELFRRRGMDARLVPVPVRDEPELRAVVAELDVQGLAVTMPHKALAAGFADECGPRAARLGSANTLRRAGGRWEAEDFDGPAAADALARALDVSGARIAVVGAGGAARAAALALAGRGARVVVLARRLEAAAEVARLVGAEGAHGLDAGVVQDCDALVHATPAGSAGMPPFAIDADALPRHAVLDMVTTPADTPLLRAARAAGLQAIDGLAMLALQAAGQQRWWSEGRADPPALGEPDVESVLRSLAVEGSRP